MRLGPFRRQLRSGALRPSDFGRMLPRAMPARRRLVRARRRAAAQTGSSSFAGRRPHRNAEAGHRRPRRVRRLHGRNRPRRRQLHRRNAGAIARRIARHGTLLPDGGRFAGRSAHLARTARNLRVGDPRRRAPRRFAGARRFRVGPIHVAGAISHRSGQPRRNARDRSFGHRHPPPRGRRPEHPLPHAPRRGEIHRSAGALSQICHKTDDAIAGFMPLCAAAQIAAPPLPARPTQ